jgi:hypothetical protein
MISALTGYYVAIAVGRPMMIKSSRPEGCTGICLTIVSSPRLVVISDGDAHIVWTMTADRRPQNHQTWGIRT